MTVGSLRIAGAWVWLLFCSAVANSTAPAAESPDLGQTARFAASCQNQDGGFGSAPGQPSTLGSTTAGVRVLLYTGSSIPDVLACIRYVRSCFDPATGGFASVPGGTPEVGTTASGLMAIGELKIDDPPLIDAAVAYLSRTAKTFPDVRIAIAGLEAVGRKSDAFPAWQTLVLSTRNPDGTWGNGPTRPFDTGGSAAALLRMGAELSNRPAVIHAILSGQQDDGGWTASADGPSELGATYRVVRCLYMLDSPPDLSRLRQFVANCRADSGAYSDRPGGHPTLGSTYTATILLRWANLLEGLPPLLDSAGFLPLFNGTDLNGWQGDPNVWSARDAMIVGASAQGLPHNNFLATQNSYADFILRLSFRLKDGSGNSGVQFRSKRLPGHEVSGYQADIGEDYWGSLYDESRRNQVLVRASDSARQSVRPDRWNQYEIRAIGPNIRLSLNGRESVTFVEHDESIPRDGLIALQVHSGGPIEVRFRDLLIQPLPQPTETASNPPGFHLRRLANPNDPRPYTLYLPTGYDGRTKFPVVLFLHGSGERGSDGVTPAQVGLGPQILAHPDRYPFIAVFPQARESWAADGPDAASALAVLDEVLRDFATDPDRVYLTGLSMGGSGSWDLAAKHPDRFAAALVVCGSPRNAKPDDLQSLPVWAITGDADRPALVSSLRALADALRSAGSPARYSEYRGVGHNSWDRAYSDPEIIQWLLAQRKSAN